MLHRPPRLLDTRLAPCTAFVYPRRSFLSSHRLPSPSNPLSTLFLSTAPPPFTSFTKASRASRATAVIHEPFRPGPCVLLPTQLQPMGNLCHCCKQRRAAQSQPPRCRKLQGQSPLLQGAPPLEDVALQQRRGRRQLGKTTGQPRCCKRGGVANRQPTLRPHASRRWPGMLQCNAWYRVPVDLAGQRSRSATLVVQ